MPITNQEKWDKYVSKNKDSYGKACVDVARRVMEILDENDKPIESGYHPNTQLTHGMIVKADRGVHNGQSELTGFMAGVVSVMITHCHSRGEEWKKVWNKENTGDKIDGVNNPALMTIEKNPNQND